MLKLIALCCFVVAVTHGRSVENQLDKLDAEGALENIFEDLKEVQNEFDELKRGEDDEKDENDVDVKIGLISDIKPDPGEKDEPPYKRAYQNNAAKFWVPDSTGLLEIPYKFVGGVYTSNEKNAIQDSISSMNSHLTGCHNNAWVPAEARHDEQVVIEFGKRGGCWSYVGKVAHLFPASFPNKVQPISIDNRCFAKGIIQHEMLHAMGFHHEQSRPDRDQFVNINFENIIERFKSNFNKATSVVPNYANLSTYDYDSVMHYGARDFSNNGQAVIVPLKSGVSIGQRRGLSPKDVKELRNLFKCSDTATTTTAPVTTSEAPVTTSEAPVTTSEAPVTTTEAPVTTTKAPITTSEAPVTTGDPRTTFEVLNCNFTKTCRGSPLNGLVTRFKRISLRTRKEYLPGKTNCTDRKTICDIVPKSLCTMTSPFKWTALRNCPKLCDNCPRNSNSYLVSKYRRRGYFTAYSRFTGSQARCDAASGLVTVATSFDFKSTGAYKVGENQLYVYLLAYSRVNRRWVKKGRIYGNVINADTPQNVWNEFHIESDFTCSDFYYVYLSTGRYQRRTVSIDNLKVTITK